MAETVFTAYAVQGRTLTPDLAFPALALLNLLAVPMFMLPDQIAAVVQGAVSLKRIQAWPCLATSCSAMTACAVLPYVVFTAMIKLQLVAMSCPGTKGCAKYSLIRMEEFA